jgi:hypothetical protein
MIILMRCLSLCLPYIHLSIIGSQRNFSVYVIVRDILSRNRRLRQLLSLMALHFVMDRECSAFICVKQVSYFCARIVSPFRLPWLGDRLGLRGYPGIGPAK